MDEEVTPLVELLTACVGAKIVSVSEGEDGVKFRLSDGQVIIIEVDDETGFVISTDQDIIH